MSEENLANNELDAPSERLEEISEEIDSEASPLEETVAASEAASEEVDSPEEKEAVEQDPTAEVVKSASEVIERAKAALSEGRQQASPAGRDVPVSSLVHLMGLATSSQVSVIEKQLDNLANRMTILTAKLERIATQLEIAQDGAALDRIDFQLADIKSILKRVLPQAMAGSVQGSDSGTRPIVVSSSTPEEQKEILKKAQEAEAYQRSEAKRVRADAQEEQGTEEE